MQSRSTSTTVANKLIVDFQLYSSDVSDFSIWKIFQSKPHHMDYT